MTSLFADILITSLEATFIAAIIIFIKKIFAAKMNIRIGYLLWLLLLIRLVFPVLPQSPVSIFNPVSFNATNINFVNSLSQAFESIFSKQGSEKNSTALTPEISENSAGRINKTNGSAASDTPESVPSAIAQETTAGKPLAPPLNHRLIKIFSIIWAVGAGLIATYYFIVNAVFAARLKTFTKISPPPELVDSIKAKAKIRRPISFVESESINTPCVFGVIRTTILLPKGFLEKSDATTLSHILTHEFAHIKHGDLALCWLTSLICAIHWFNPVIWYCSVLVKRDQEFCADAFAMSLIDEESVYEYGRTLLSTVVQSKYRRHALVTAGITENKHTVMQRIKNIAAFSKKKYRLTLIGIGLVVLAGLFLCTSQVDYPKTGQERMAFDDNIQMAVNPVDNNQPRIMNLQIYNRNKIAIHSCELEIYNGNPYKPESRLVYSNKNFRISGKKSKSLYIEGMDYHSAYIRFNFKVGFAFDNSNRTSQSGGLEIFDKTTQINGWKQVTEEEISAFIKENNINAIAINRLYGFYTVIIFKNGDASGYYELYKNSKTSKLSSRWVKGYGGNDTPVQMMGGTASGSYPFVNFKINHPALLAFGDKIQIETDNGVITDYVSGISAHTVETKGYGNINKILIYDKSNKLIFDGVKALFDDVHFNAEDRTYDNLTREKGFKILDQTTVSQEISFTSGMFPKNYVVAYKSGDMDWKIPLLSYENTTIYLKCIVEANESPEQLYAMLYMIHHVKNAPGKILSGNYIIFENNTSMYSNKVFVKRDVFSAGSGIIKDAVSLRGSGPGDQVHFYIDKSMVEKTNGNFTVTLEGLNLISYAPK